MAKEYSGVLLVVVALMQSEKGRRVLVNAWKKGFCKEGKLADWVMIVETLLVWEAYLNQSQMPHEEVKRLKHKNGFLLYLLKTVCDRQQGMRFRILKFHAITHLADDTIMFGVPTNVDTGVTLDIQLHPS